MVEVRLIEASQLPRAAAFVASLQSDPEHHLGEFGSDAAGIATRMREVEPFGLASLYVAVQGEEIVGLLQAEWDTDPPRVWWQGPMVRAGGDWHALADALYDAARRIVPPTVTQQELGPDRRNHRVAAFASRHGFVAEVASAVLARSLTDPPAPATPEGVTIRPLEREDRTGTAALHDLLFPTAHLPGERLDEDRDRIVLTARAEGHLIGYAVAERQEDGDGYLDFLGVAESARVRGVGRALVAATCAGLRRTGARSLHLTVREDNPAARRLYAALGFTEERVLVPWRRGFTAG